MLQDFTIIMARDVFMYELYQHSQYYFMADASKKPRICLKVHPQISPRHQKSLSWAAGYPIIGHGHIDYDHVITTNLQHGFPSLHLLLSFESLKHRSTKPSTTIDLRCPHAIVGIAPSCRERRGRHKITHHQHFEVPVSRT